MHDRTSYLNEGMEAGLNGAALEACPYPAASREALLWVQGWHCAVDENGGWIDPTRTHARL